jgi:repressor LexA
MRSQHLDLTPLQQQVYDFIRAQIETNHCPPTMGEIAARFSWKSQNAAWTHVDALLRKGLITKVPHSARGLRLVELPTLTPATLLGVAPVAPQ